MNISNISGNTPFKIKAEEIMDQISFSMLRHTTNEISSNNDIDLDIFNSLHKRITAVRTKLNNIDKSQKISKRKARHKISLLPSASLGLLNNHQFERKVEDMVKTLEDLIL